MRSRVAAAWIEDTGRDEMRSGLRFLTSYKKFVQMLRLAVARNWERPGRSARAAGNPERGPQRVQAGFAS